MCAHHAARPFHCCVCVTPQGKLDPVVGRKKEIERVIQILGRRTKNNPCLIGEPGVGKTAVAEGLAQKIATGDVPETIEGKQVWTGALELSAMVLFLLQFAPSAVVLKAPRMVAQMST